MTRGAQITASQSKAVVAFEVEVETMWVKLTRLRPGKVANVWLTPRWVLSMSHRPMSVQVGGSPYSRDVPLSWFRQDCFDALDGRRGRG